MQDLVSRDEIDEKVELVWREYLRQLFDEIKLKKSGCRFSRIKGMCVDVLPYTAKNVGSYIPLAQEVKSVINIKN